MIRYISIRITNSRGPEIPISIGPIEDATTLRELFRQCMEKASGEIPEQDRGDSRHFWHQGLLLPYEGKRLSDISTAANLSLELRPDGYSVAFLKQPAREYVIDPEQRVGITLRELLRGMASPGCVEVFVRQEGILDLDKTLLEQNVLPYQTGMHQDAEILEIRSKPCTWVTTAVIAITLAFIGGVLGYIVSKFIQR